MVMAIIYIHHVIGLVEFWIVSSVFREWPLSRSAAVDVFCGSRIQERQAIRTGSEDRGFVLLVEGGNIACTSTSGNAYRELNVADSPCFRSDNWMKRVEKEVIDTGGQKICR